MRKHSPRKWLHAVLDLLPVILIPVFMIYSHRHNVDDNSLVVQESKVVDFNQIIYNGYFDNTNGWYANTGNLELVGNALEVTCTSSNSGHFATSLRQNNYYLEVIKDNKYYVSFYIYSNISFRGGCYLPRLGGVNNYRNYNSDELTRTELIVDAVSTGSDNVYFGFESAVNVNDYLQVSQFEVINLTQMFGVGNEPTIEQFDTYFPDTYYSYTLSENVLIENYVTITYNDSDIMSQFFYCMYNSVDKYFNMGNVFGMKNVYRWFEINFFGGTAPSVVYIVYNIIVYEFIMDLFFLLYSVFMFIIDFAERLMTSFFDKSFGGGR